MAGESLRERCSVNTNQDEETFVGIRRENGEIRVQFPLGYAPDMKDDRMLQRDIFLLLTTIRRTTAKMDSRLHLGQEGERRDAFPLQAYLAVLLDFFERGYYRERETVYRTAKRGKIHWGKTIKTMRPFVQEDEVLYLDFVTRQSKSSERELITRIHEYCVYESFVNAGWLFLSGVPQKPKIPLQKKKFLSVLHDRLTHTFDDKNRRLFRSMTEILSYRGNADGEDDFYYGTNRFEYVWERLVDEVYGIAEKTEFFPQTAWVIGNTVTAGSHLKPDTIMVCGSEIYVLDAKYYRYGATMRPGDLPESASVHKQITYGEYIDTQRRFAERYGEDLRIYNAFLMPYDASDPRFAGASGSGEESGSAVPCPDGESAGAMSGSAVPCPGPNGEPGQKVASAAPGSAVPCPGPNGEPGQKVASAAPGPAGSLPGVHAPLLRIGEALSDWKRGRKSYERVQGILVDVKYLMRLASGRDVQECERLAECIRRYADGG